jgi:hypothetical protein
VVPASNLSTVGRDQPDHGSTDQPRAHKPPGHQDGLSVATEDDVRRLALAPTFRIDFRESLYRMIDALDEFWRDRLHDRRGRRVGY